MRRYTPTEISEFLKSIDRHLEKAAALVIIGGTAAAIAYDFERPTQDIDTAYSVKDLEEAISAARAETGFDIPVGQAGVYDAPYQFEDRLIAFTDVKFERLSVFVPEAVDFILMKTMRAEEHDLQAIERIVQKSKVGPDQILRRYLDEMNEANKKESERDFNVRVVIERCFGPGAEEAAAKSIALHRKAKKSR